MADVFDDDFEKEIEEYLAKNKTPNDDDASEKAKKLAPIIPLM